MFDPAEGTPGIDDNAPGSPPPTQPAPDEPGGHCASCGDPHDFITAVCPVCAATGACTVCGQQHRATACPDVARVRKEMAAADEVAHRQEIAAWADMLRAEYEAWPIWKEAA